MKKYLTVLLNTLAFSLAAQTNTSNWFTFQPQPVSESSVINMHHWLDKPAGKHGFLGMKGKDFVFEDGTKTKFWGVNICSDMPFVENEEAIKWTRFMAAYGINGVRFHKFTWYANDGIHSTQLTQKNWDNFDFFCNELRNAGVYYSWSHIYGHRVLQADSSRMLNYEEVKNTKFPWAHLNGTTASLVNYAEDLQAINIELTVNMLNHKNAHTGLRYADDPALSFIELQNEDNIFWGAIEETLKQTPTYRALLCKKFSQWLKKKYSTHEQMINAWNNSGLGADESLEKENIYPHPNHGLFSWEYEQAVKENRSVPQHIADRAAFLYEEQVNFYSKFIQAIRETGYKGVIVGSCWQAGSGITHFYNLHADYLAGAVDRHNYYGGGGGHRLQPGRFNNTPMISMPGSGLLSTGFQQVADRPFMISEWMSLIPTEWTVESAPLIAIYGMGLQGWDASYAFAMDYSTFTPTVQSGHGIYNVTSPTQLGLYPALAAMVYRGDVAEGEVIANRNVNITDLQKGKLDFLEKTSQSHDIKSFQAAIPMEALAAGAVTISFDQPEKNTQVDLAPYWNRKSKTITSNTGQLQWAYREKGYSTINTPGTKGLIGFASDKTFQLNEVTLNTSNEFAVILITSLDKNLPISASKKILVTTIARAQNTGMKFNEGMTELLDVGTPPIVLEPVNVSISIERKGKPRVHVLDHSGHRTGKEVQVKKGAMKLNGATSGALYYLIEY